MAAKEFSIAAMCRAKLAGTWEKIVSTESRIIQTLHERLGVPDGGGGDLIPGYALASRATTLTTLAPVAAGYLIDTTLADYWPALQASSITLQLGATPVLLDKGAANIPVGLSAVQTYWASDEVSPQPAGPPSFNVLPLIRHNLFAYTEITRQLLLQSNADDILRREISRALGSEADRVILGGSGANGQPFGIVNCTGIGTVSGTNLPYGSLVSAMTAVSNANAVLDANRLGWATTPNVATLLKQRYRVSTGERPLWKGQIAAGSIERAPASTSTHVPANTLIFGDWSQVLVAQWPDGLSIAIDPFTKFQTGIVAIRACLSIDVQLRTPAAFTIATGVT